MRVVCPHCGERSIAEFSYGGDASIARPALDASTDDWCTAVYDRRNPRGRHLEYWQHAQGCRAWIRVERDTATHAICEATLVGRSVGEGG